MQGTITIFTLTVHTACEVGCHQENEKEPFISKQKNSNLHRQQ
jgi:hypothetical protein